MDVKASRIEKDGACDSSSTHDKGGADGGEEGLECLGDGFECRYPA